MCQPVDDPTRDRPDLRCHRRERRQAGNLLNFPRKRSNRSYLPTRRSSARSPSPTWDEDDADRRREIITSAATLAIRDHRSTRRVREPGVTRRGACSGAARVPDPVGDAVDVRHGVGDRARRRRSQRCGSAVQRIRPSDPGCRHVRLQRAPAVDRTVSAHRPVTDPAMVSRPGGRGMAPATCAVEESRTPPAGCWREPGRGDLTDKCNREQTAVDRATGHR